eukprot:gene14769-biopygen6641
MCSCPGINTDSCLSRDAGDAVRGDRRAQSRSGQRTGKLPSDQGSSLRIRTSPHSPHDPLRIPQQRGVAGGSRPGYAAVLLAGHHRQHRRRWGRSVFFAAVPMNGRDEGRANIAEG